MKEFATYTAARLGLFATCFAVALGVAALVTDGPVPVFWPLVVAALLSMVLATVLLRGMRDRFAQRVAERADRMTQAQRRG